MWAAVSTVTLFVKGKLAVTAASCMWIAGANHLLRFSSLQSFTGWCYKLKICKFNLNFIFRKKQQKATTLPRLCLTMMMIFCNIVPHPQTSFKMTLLDITLTFCFLLKSKSFIEAMSFSVSLSVCLSDWLLLLFNWKLLQQCCVKIIKQQ